MAEYPPASPELLHRLDCGYSVEYVQIVEKHFASIFVSMVTLIQFIAMDSVAGVSAAFARTRRCIHTGCPKESVLGFVGSIQAFFRRLLAVSLGMIWQKLSRADGGSACIGVFRQGAQRRVFALSTSFFAGCLAFHVV